MASVLEYIEEIVLHLPRFVTATAILALLLSSFVCYGQTEEEAILAQAREHLSNRKYYFASTWLERLLRDHPATPQRREALLLIIKVYDLSGRSEKAVPYVRALVKEFPQAAATLDSELLDLAKVAAADSQVSAIPPIKSPPEEKKTASTAAKAPAAKIPEPTIPGERPRSAPSPSAATTAQDQTKAAAAPSTPEPKSAAVEPAPLPPTLSPEKVTPPSEIVQPTVIAIDEAYYAMTDGITDGKTVESLLKALKASGLQPVVREDVTDVEMQRLVLACYDTMEAAQKRKISLSSKIRDGFIFRDAERYCLVAASVKSETAAAQEQKRLARKGLQVNIVKARVSIPVSQIFVGRFTQAQEAEAVVNIIATHGTGAKVVKAVN